MGCHFCGGKSIRFGKTGSGKVRFQCTICLRTFGRKRSLAVTFLDFCRFRDFVAGITNRQGITRLLKIRRETLSERFKIFFDCPVNPVDLWEILPPQMVLGNNSWIYGVDGKHLHHDGVFLIHRDVTNRENIFWSFWPSESYLALESDIKTLVELISLFGKNFPVGAISDWKGAIVAAVGCHFGPIPHQRCLTHVGNLAKRLLPENSPYQATRQLRLLAKGLSFLNNKLEMVDWLWELELWKQKYGEMLKEKTWGIGTRKKWWYTHGNLLRGFRLLTRDQGPFFVYLDNSLIPKTNNSLEGVNGQAVQKLGDHRGMKIPQQASFLSWHLTFGRVKNRGDLKKLWALWKEGFFQRLPTRKDT